jgi:ABC-2 type transport system permease protein
VRNRTVVWTFLLVAAIFVLLPLTLAFGFTGPLAAELERDPRGTEMLDLLAAYYPAVDSLAPEGRLQVMVLRQLLPLFLILPLLGGVGVAAYSVVGEKVSRSLEPLLATPLTAGELLLGKTVAAALPATAGTWIAFGLFGAGVRALGGAAIARLVLDLAAWGMMALIVPLVALLGIGAGVVVSARARDPRGAQQIGGLLVLPVVALVVAQTAGVFLLGPGFVAVGAVVLALVDAALLAWGSRRFDRERVFVDWR